MAIYCHRQNQGLGIEFDEKAALANPYREVEAPQLRRPDGAFTNW